MGTRPLLTRAPSDLVYHDHGKNAILCSVHTAEHEWTVATINVYLFFSCHMQKDVMMHRDLCSLFDDGMIIMDQDVARHPFLIPHYTVVSTYPLPHHHEFNPLLSSSSAPH
jgi:hypothetical protein